MKIRRNSFFLLFLIITLLLAVSVFIGTPVKADTLSGDFAGNTNVHWQLEGSVLTITADTAEQAIPNFGSRDPKPYDAYSSEIKRVVVDSTVTELGNYAFASLSALERAEIRGDVKIDARVFAGCTSLTHVSIAGNLTGFGLSAMENTALKHLRIDGNAPRLTTISGTAPCGGLDYCLYVANGDASWTEDVIAKIGGTALKVLTHSSPEEEAACTGCENSHGAFTTGVRWHYLDGVLTVTGSGKTDTYTASNVGTTSDPFKELRSRAEELVVGEGITELGNYVFYQFEELTSVTFPGTLQKLQARCLSKCGKLSVLELPAGITVLGGYCLADSGIKELHFAGNVPNTVSTTPCGGMTYQLFVNCNWKTDGIAKLGGNLKGVTFAHTYTTDESVCDICHDGAQGDLTATIRWSVCNIGGERCLILSGTGDTPNSENKNTTLPWYAYRDVITGVIVEDGIAKLDKWTFYSLPALKWAELAASVTRLETRVFRYCSALETVHIYGNLEFLGLGVFTDTAVKDLYFYGNLPTSFSPTASCTGLTYTIHYIDGNSSWDGYVSSKFGGAPTPATMSGNCTVGTQSYGSVSTAIAAMNSGGTVKLCGNDTRGICLGSKSVYLDLNGFTVTGGISGNNAKLYGMDSANNSYATTSSRISGSISSGVEFAPLTTATQGGITRSYLCVKDAEGVSFHRVYMKLSSKVLRPIHTRNSVTQKSSPGVFFKAAFAGDTTVKTILDGDSGAYGIGFWGYDPRDPESDGFTVSKENVANCKTENGFIPAALNSGRGVVVTNILSEEDSDERNNAYANYRFYFAPYLEVPDGNGGTLKLWGEVESTCLRDLVEEIDGIAEQLTEEQKRAVSIMYDDWKNVMGDWNLPNLKELLADSGED